MKEIRRSDACYNSFWYVFFKSYLLKTFLANNKYKLNLNFYIKYMRFLISLFPTLCEQSAILIF